MNIRVAINGFGRIGRSVCRILCDHPSIEVVCINDIFKNEALAYLLKYDTIMGTLKQDVTHDDHALYVGGKKILMTSVRNPAEAKWKELGIDVVIESTGIFTARADLEKHLTAGANRVLLTVPPKDNVDHMVVMGVNDDQLKPEHRLVSNASCTTNCLAPLAKVSDDSVVDLVVELEKYPDKEAINEAVRRSAEGPLKSVLEYSEVPLVSSD